MLMIASLLCGLVFGAGLLISGMVQPTKVLGFLDVFGAWDPSLAIVMIAALVVSIPGFMLAKHRTRPLFAAESFWPTKMGLDRPLLIGSALFGIGWGLSLACVRARHWRASQHCRPAYSRSSLQWPQAWVCMISGKRLGRRSDVKTRLRT